MFGQSASTSTFGQPSAFNSTATPFGTMNSQPQQGSLFGQSSNTSLFGMNQQTPSLFGTPSTSQTSTFGAQPAFGNTSLFGNNSTQQQSNSLFGSTNRFSMPTSNSLSAFGNTLGQSLNVPTGTTIKFNPQSATDTIMKNGHSQSTSINIRLQCITCMREYESKSLEELRLEDYNANRKGPQQSGNLFGNSSLNTGTFGGTSTNTAFGSSTQSLFSQNKPFGSIAPTTTTSTNNFFGSNLNTNKPSLFGNNTSTSGGIFGLAQNSLNTNTSLDPSKTFMTPTSQPSLFGQNNQNNFSNNKPMFGSMTTPFGGQQQQPQPTGSSFFGNNTTGTSIFGASSQPSLFNTTNNTATNTFGASKPINFNFTSQPTGGLATATSTSSLFGGASNTFGSNTGSNLFGSSNLGSNTFGNFGSSNLSFQNTNSSFQFNPSSFGNNTFNSSFPTNNNVNNTQSGLANTAVANTDQIITRLQTLPYGSPSLLPVDSSFSFNNIKTKFTTDPKTLNQYKINAKSQTEVKVARVPVSGKPTTLLFDGLDDESSDNLKCAQDIFTPRQNIKKLVLGKNGSSPFIKDQTMKTVTSIVNTSFNNENESPQSLNTSVKQVMENTIDVINNLANENKQVTSSSPDKALHSPTLSFPSNTDTSTKVIPKCSVILTRADYYTIPYIEECDSFYNADNDTCIVDSFTVGRVNYGSIYWKGPLNIKGLNLDEIVHIRRKEVIVYPDDDVKPPVGEGLNRPAQVTLDQVWPIDKATREFIKDPERLRTMKYAEKIESVTVKLGANFKEYRPDTGSWVFTVKHFSKYGLDAEDEEVDIEPKHSESQLQNLTQPKEISKHADPPLLGGVTTEALNGEPKLMGLDLSSLTNPDMILAKDLESASNLSNYYKYDSFFGEDDEMAEVKLGNLKSGAQNDNFSLMRSALFLEQEESDDIVTSAKKCKNLSFTKSTVSHAAGPFLFPSKLKTSIPKKRNLNFDVKCNFTEKANILSFSYSPAPRVNFVNGSNKFCFVVGNQVLLLKLDLLELENSNATEKLEEHLAHYSSIEHASKSSYPPIIKSKRLSLNGKLDANLNSLVEALYGELSEASIYSRHQERIRRIQNWLFNYNKTLPVPEKPFLRIIHFLTTNELEFAITECINTKQPRLSYLVSCGSYCNKSLLVSQLDSWKRSEADVHIDRDLLKIYVLLAGLSKWTLSNGEAVNQFEGLHWTQQLILLLLYKSMAQNEFEIIGTNLVKCAINELMTHPNVVEYHLLAQHQPWTAMAACSSLIDSWFLHQSLFSFNVIVDDAFTNKSDSIHLMLASQFTSLRWSLFFALHVKNNLLRLHCTRELLTRNAAQLVDSKLVSFLCEHYYIDSHFINEAKLFYAKTFLDEKTIAFNLIESNNLNEAHDIIVDKVFPELVINEDYREIAQLIDRLRPQKNSISNWNLTGAGIYDTFIQLLKFNGTSDLALYKQLIENYNVNQMRCPTKRHVLCQSQMTRVANIIHAELNDGMYAYNTSVPDDYALIELRSNAYKLLEMGSTCT